MAGDYDPPFVEVGPKRGIHARTMLPSPTYDHCFTLEFINGSWCCVFKRDGSISRITADYFEEVPMPVDEVWANAGERPE